MYFGIYVIQQFKTIMVKDVVTDIMYYECDDVWTDGGVIFQCHAFT